MSSGPAGRKHAFLEIPIPQVLFTVLCCARVEKGEIAPCQAEKLNPSSVLHMKCYIICWWNQSVQNILTLKNSATGLIDPASPEWPRVVAGLFHTAVGHEKWR